MIPIHPGIRSSRSISSPGSFITVRTGIGRSLTVITPGNTVNLSRPLSAAPPVTSRRIVPALPARLPSLSRVVFAQIESIRKTEKSRQSETEFFIHKNDFMFLLSYDQSRLFSHFSTAFAGPFLASRISTGRPASTIAFGSSSRIVS